MIRRRTVTIVILALAAGMLSGCSRDEVQKPIMTAAGLATNAMDPARDGAALFKQYCAACHPGGGNVSDPERSLYGSALKRNHITTPEDIIRVIRRPMSRMISFDAAALSDRDARVIAEYVLKTFK
jgi:cytochrome c6